MDAPKKGVSMLAIKFGGGKPMPSDKSADEPAGDDTSSADSSEYEAAAGEVLDAIKANDKAALAEALQSFHDMCNMGEPDAKA